jgi:hypothetical protein
MPPIVFQESARRKMRGAQRGAYQQMRGGVLRVEPSSDSFQYIHGISCGRALLRYTCSHKGFKKFSLYPHSEQDDQDLGILEVRRHQMFLFKIMTTKIDQG